MGKELINYIIAVFRKTDQKWHLLNLKMRYLNWTYRIEAIEAPMDMILSFVGRNIVLHSVYGEFGAFQAFCYPTESSPDFGVSIFIF